MHVVAAQTAVIFQRVVCTLRHEVVAERDVAKAKAVVQGRISLGIAAIHVRAGAQEHASHALISKLASNHQGRVAVRIARMRRRWIGAKHHLHFVAPIARAN